jgi:hypothetical protein
MGNLKRTVMKYPFLSRSISTSRSAKALQSTLMLALLGSSLAATQAQEAARFPFVMPWNDAAKTVTDVSFLNPAPLTEKQRIVIKNGHFFDQTGRRVRILGTNFSSGANFPNKEDAAKVAARLRKLGFNCVRLHHMDATWANPNIFGRNNAHAEQVAAESLDRLDYLVYQLKKNGIYVDLNLHVSWAPNAGQGFPNTDKLPTLGKTTSYFEKRSIEHQKNYARQFLTHVNPYTKLKWADDPAVALIELTNEDTLVGEGWGDTLLNLPPYYRDQLQAKWNTWLQKKYVKTEALTRAWTGGRDLGANILRNARFEQGETGWAFERQQGQYEHNVEEIAPANGNGPQGRAVHFKITELGTEPWHQQFHQNGLNFQNGETYTVQFWAKADKARRLPVGSAYDQAPWTQITRGQTFNVGTEWKRYCLVMTANNPLPNHNRLSFILGEALGDLWLADISIQPGFVVEFEPGQSLESGNISLVRASNTPQGRDYVAFLVDVERDYVKEMVGYIKNDLRAKGLVTCSQAWLGGLAGVSRESRTDWVDMHAYWQHPDFPNKPWDPKDWRMPNTSMVREFGGGTLPQLAMHRVAGKPFTVTEYNHPAPNEYASETLPLICAYAAWQDWDGVFLFGYYGDDENWNTNRIRGFFDADSDPNKMATMPAAALMFLGGQVPPITQRQSTLVMPRDSVVRLTARTGLSGFWDSNVPGLWNAAGATRNDWLRSRMAVRWVDGNGEPKLLRSLPPATRSDALSWHTDSPTSALFTVDTPRAKAAIGFLGGQWFDWNGLSVQMDKTLRNFVTMTLTPLDNKPIAQSQSLLLTALSDVQNQGMVWNADRTSVSDQWGSGPTLAEGIPAAITLHTAARKATVHALDATGKRVRTVPSQLQNNRLTFRIGPQWKTLWYHIEVTPTSRPAASKAVKTVVKKR